MTRMSRFQAGFNLATNEVVRVVEAPAAVFISDTHPILADHDEHYLAGRDSPADNFHEIIARLYGVDVSNDVLAPEVSSQALIEPSGGITRLPSPSPCRRHHASGRCFRSSCLHAADPWVRSPTRCSTLREAGADEAANWPRRSPYVY
jgi:hypothetical protein